jgi:ORF6N domain
VQCYYESTVLASTDFIATKILFLRDEKVLLDADLALLYGVETKVLKQAVRRNIERFPPDFLFELSIEERSALRSQFVTLEKDRGNRALTFDERALHLRSQFASLE